MVHAHVFRDITFLLHKVRRIHATIDHVVVVKLVIFLVKHVLLQNLIVKKYILKILGIIINIFFIKNKECNTCYANAAINNNVCTCNDGFLYIANASKLIRPASSCQ